MKTIVDVLVKADRGLYLKVNRLRTNWQNKCFSYLTNLGGVFFQTSLAILLILFPSTREIGFKLGIIQLVVTAIVQLIKRLVSRVRPYTALANIIPLKTEKDQSFPSGHTAAAFTTALAISNTVPVLSAVGFGLALLIGYSRIYIGVHYPSDVIVGGLVGIGTTAILLP